MDFTNKLSFVSFCIVLHRFGWPIKRNLGPFCTCSKNHQNLVLVTTTTTKAPWVSGWNVQTNRPTNHNQPPQVVGTVEDYLSDSCRRTPCCSKSWRPLSSHKSWTGDGEEENGQPAQCRDLKTGDERKTWAGSPPLSLKLNASWVTSNMGMVQIVHRDTSNIFYLASHSNLPLT